MCFSWYGGRDSKKKKSVTQTVFLAPRESATPSLPEDLYLIPRTVPCPTPPLQPTPPHTQGFWLAGLLSPLSETFLPPFLPLPNKAWLCAYFKHQNVCQAPGAPCEYNAYAHKGRYGDRALRAILLLAQLS